MVSTRGNNYCELLARKEVKKGGRYCVIDSRVELPHCAASVDSLLLRLFTIRCGNERWNFTLNIQKQNQYYKLRRSMKRLHIVQSHETLKCARVLHLSR